MKKIERVQSGVRLEKKLLKSLKALAEYLDLSLSDLMEGIFLHVFDGKQPFSEKNLTKITEIKNVYDLKLKASDSHKLREEI